MSGQKFSLSFTKTIEKRTLQPSAIRNDAPLEAKVNTENLESIEENVLKTDAKPEEQDLVIPMIATDRLSILRKIAERKIDLDEKHQDADKSDPEKSKEDKKELPDEQRVLTLDEQAEAAILEESKKKLEDWTERGVSDSLAISHTNEDATTEAGPSHVKESSLDDYDQVDISVFGAALLRGMGWQKSEGIGRHTKKVVEVIDPTAKTLGLANTPGDAGKKAGENLSGDQEELLLAKGSFVFIHSGRHRGTYGVVESLDEDHMLVKSAVGQEVIREVELNVRVVSQKEYKDSSRVINKDMYDKFKEDEARKNDRNKNKPSKNAEYSKKEKEIKEEKLLIEDSDVKDKVKLEKNRETPRDEIEQERKTFKDKKSYPDVKRENDDDYSYRKQDDKREVDKGKTQSRLEKYSSSDKYKNDERYRYDKKDKYEGKSERNREKYSSLYDNKKTSKSQYREDTHQEKYSDSAYDKSIRKSESSSESKSYKRKEKESSSYRDDYKKAKKLQEQMPVIPWVRENLRVRLINKDYKGGRYHKEKVIVKFVETAESCECVTEEGKTLREVHPAWLETVIPKRDPQIILIVKGKQKGQRGRILQLHKDQEKASVQLLEDETDIIKLHYDDICEYVSQF